MGWLVEQAGGAATNGKQRILDIQPAKLHERVSVILGSKRSRTRDQLPFPAIILVLRRCSSVGRAAHS